ncbi:sulfite exporter TauE/SafE family protein [Anoxynatronum buryatiense]|uniref:Sulfite exporter TauE/SafE n=1 Tax=Anoxynatronum buryatiense TaxID=489973 RepID=A0AA46AHX1_9CLOT|nr:sulfite exporter TauE/SafE family protein [Anoxynatronum buryatiense]SMP43959.1 Sulfite exporter TauE/SafE [Anoxynatronum buryatiense]
MDHNHLTLNVDGMTCTGCEQVIQRSLLKHPGVVQAEADFVTASVSVSFTSPATPKSIRATIENAGYAPQVKAYSPAKASIGWELPPPIKAAVKWAGLALFLLLAYRLIQKADSMAFLPEIQDEMSYGILFVIGLLTSLHCVTMCGGIALSQCIGAGDQSNLPGRLRPSLLYNGGRIVSYTIIGGFIGALGSVISMTLRSQGIVVIIAGVFMMIMGLNLLGLFPVLRRLIPRLPAGLGGRLADSREGRGPFVVGLINGFMPCGPLQTMQLYALGTGSFVAGATSMFFFSLGTAPLLFALGALSTFVSQRFNRRMLAASGVLVMLLGAVMITRGLSLTGTAAPSFTAPSYSNVAMLEDGRQVVRIELEPYYYEPIVVQKGIPVTFIVHAEQQHINGCNNAIVIPAFDVRNNIVAGENLFEFTPTETGTIAYSCWMGMIRSSIQVVDDLSTITPSAVPASPSQGLPEAPADDCCSGPFSS